METFKTFKPNNSTILKYVDYYYLDIKPENSFIKIKCYPNFKNCISIYKSHILLNNTVTYDESEKYLHIFTPIQNDILTVKQKGKVHRIVIVFKPLGIQQFFTINNFSEKNFKNYFSVKELEELFNTDDSYKISAFLDSFLLARYKKFENKILSKTLNSIFEIENKSIGELANDYGVSGKHLNRIFKNNIGISIHKYRQIVLFRKALNQKLFENPTLNFTQIAYDLYFTDQSHLIKNFKKLTSKSPKNLIKEGTVLGNEGTFWEILE